MTDTPRLWDRRADETPKSYAAFLALGARRSVPETPVYASPPSYRPGRYTFVRVLRLTGGGCGLPEPLYVRALTGRIVQGSPRPASLL